LRSNISVLFANQFKAFQTFETTYFVEHYTNYIKPMFMTEFETFEVFRSIKPKWYEQFVNNKNYKQIMNYTITNCIMFIQYQTGLKEIAEAIYNKQYNTIANAKPAPSPAPALIGRLSSDSQFRQGSGAAGIRTGAPTQRLLKPLCVIV
jgi:hypothetical protein